MKKRERVLIVDDDAEIRALVETALSPAFDLRGAATGEKALEALWSFGPDILLLDLTLPGFRGEALLKLIRSDPRLCALPILILTGDEREKTLLDSLDAGADDLLVKPFSPLELAARVRALLRRRRVTPAQDRFIAGPIELVLSTHQVFVEGEETALTATEFSILQLLIQRAGEVVAKDGILEFLWGNVERVQTRTVDTHLANLRKKLGPAAAHIETVREFGLRLKT